jgi:PAS domain S-box-containing protein
MTSAMFPDGGQPDAWFERIVEAALDAILVVDRNRLITFANGSAERFFGFGRAELIGRPLEQLIPERFRAQHLAHYARFIADPKARAMGAGLELFGLRKDGVEIPIEIGLNPIETRGGELTLASITDISQRRRSEQARQQMSALVESAEDAILTKSLDGIVRSWNPGAERMLGYRADQIVGQPVTMLIPDDRLDEELMIINQIRNGQRVAHFETVRRRIDGTMIEVSLTISPVRDSAGTIVGASKIMRDITDRKQREEDLRRTNAELQQMNKDLDQFVYTASHDLRAPLTAVSEVARWILDDDPSISSESRARIGIIQGRIERMKRMLSDIRDYARAGRSLEASGTTSTAAELILAVLSTTHIPSGFTVRCDPALANIVVFRVPLQQIFHNLISNAIKHHDASTGAVEIKADSDGVWHCFSVIDDGPGIPQQYRESIFEMFSTLKPRDSVEGSGMGLALVRRYVEKMGGRCGCDPVGERGTRFWFRWPCIPVPLGEPQ